MNIDVSELKKSLEEKSEARKKPVETEMYWWLNMNRPFFIGDDYKIVLEKIDSANKSAKIRIINLKNTNNKANPEQEQDVSLQELLILHNATDGE